MAKTAKEKAEAARDKAADARIKAAWEKEMADNERATEAQLKRLEKALKGTGIKIVSNHRISCCGQIGPKDDYFAQLDMRLQDDGTWKTKVWLYPHFLIQLSDAGFKMHELEKAKKKKVQKPAVVKPNRRTTVVDTEPENGQPQILKLKKK